MNGRYFDYYHDALRVMTTEGLAAYAQRVAKSYLTVAVGHFDPQRTTYTERLLQRLRRHGDTPDDTASQE